MHDPRLPWFRHDCSRSGPDWGGLPPRCRRLLVADCSRGSPWGTPAALPPCSTIASGGTWACSPCKDSPRGWSWVFSWGSPYSRWP